MDLAPPAFSLRQLQYAIAVEESLSFRRAAERCHVSQPALSAQLAELEAALGVRLFERDRQRVLPTGAGRELLERARRTLQEAADLAAAAWRAGDPFTGTLRVGVIPTISPYLLPALTPALRERYPHLTVAWLEDKTEPLMQSLRAGNLDAALVALESKIGEVEREVIALDPFVLATPRRHPLGRKKDAAAPSELRDAEVLLLDDGHCFRDQALALCAQGNARELDFRATSLGTLVQMVSGGTGVTLLPRLAIATESRRADLLVRPFAEPVPHRTLGLVWRRGSPLATALEEIADTVRAAYPREGARSRTQRQRVR